MLQKDDINKKTYNAIADFYVEEANLDHEDKTYLDSFLETVSGNKILDLGCGPGILSKYLSNLGYDVTGVDFAEKMISIARELAPKTKFIVSDIARLELDDKFDGIVLAHFLVHFSEEENIRILNKLHNFMNPDASLFIQFAANLTPGIQDEPLDDTGELKMWRYSYDEDNMGELLDSCNYDTTFSETKGNVVTMISKARVKEKSLSNR